MDKSEIRTGNFDDRNRQLKGLTNKGIIILKCADCDESLLCLQLTGIDGNPQPQVLTRVAVKCDLCNGYSYVEQVPGQFYPGAPSDDMAFDIEENDANAPEVDTLFRAWRK